MKNPGFISQTLLTLGLAVLLPTTPARATLLAYEGFDYSEGVYTAAAVGLDGGMGFTGVWDDDEQAHIGAGSLTMPNLLLASTGNRVVSDFNVASARTLAPAAQMDLGVDQDYYVSFLMLRDSSSASNSGEYQNVNLRDGSTDAVSTGSTSTELFTISSLGSSVNGPPVVDGQVYLLVLKIAAVATGDDQAFLKVYDSTSTIGAEPTSSEDWTVVGGTEDSNQVIDVFRFGVASPIDGEFDEFRVGTTWADVTGFAGSHPGDANGDGMVNLADLQILGDNWQSTTASWSEADFTGDGNVNLADLQILGDNWGFGVGSDLAFDEAMAQVAIPEPAGLALLSVGAAWLLRRRA